MSKKSFAVVGSGWRAGFYLKIAKYCSEEFQVTGVLCRTEEKAMLIQKEYDVHATTSEEEILNAHPDFIVVAVTKASIAKVSQYWRNLGFVVLCETPIGMSREDIQLAYDTRNEGGRLIVAEQYMYYPTYQKLIETVESGKMGDIVSADISLAHEYHGISLLRRMLMEKYDSRYRLLAHHYELPVTKTKDRYHTYTDGEIVLKSRVTASIEFEDGKIATYDFDSEQYRSPIRHNRIRLTGTRGEIINEKLWYLDSDNLPKEEVLFKDLQDARMSNAESGLTEDETAIKALMDKTYLVSLALSKKDTNGTIYRCEETGKEITAGKMLEWQEEQLKCAILDAYFMFQLQQSNNEWINSESIAQDGGLV